MASARPVFNASSSEESGNRMMALSACRLLPRWNKTQLVASDYGAFDIDLWKRLVERGEKE